VITHSVHWAAIWGVSSMVGSSKGPLARFCVSPAGYFTNNPGDLMPSW